MEQLLQSKNCYGKIHKTIAISSWYTRYQFIGIYLWPWVPFDGNL
jgi:hypothetical protein